MIILSERKNMTLNLKEIRTKKGITQEQLASKVGVLNTSICNYETGIREPNLDTLKKLATALEVTVDELLEDTNDETGTGRETA